MVYYLRSVQSSSASEMSESNPQPDTDTDVVMAKYSPSFLHSIYALSITFVLCHILVRYFHKMVPFLCMKNKDGEIVIGKNGYAYIDHKKAWLVSGIVGVAALFISLGMVYYKQ